MQCSSGFLSTPDFTRENAERPKAEIIIEGHRSPRCRNLWQQHVIYRAQCHAKQITHPLGQASS